MSFNIPLVATGFFFFGSIFFSFLFLYKSRKVRDLFNSYKFLIIFLLIMNIFLKYPASNQFFNGLEYEDAYVYNATARYLSENKDNNNYQSFLTTCCIWGNLTNCQMSATYSGHVIGLPYILYLLNIIFGFKPLTANIVSLFFSCISVITLFLLSFIIISDIKYSVICCLIFILTPIFNVFSSTTFSEPTSMAFVSLSLLIYLAYMTDSNNNKICQYSAYLFALFFLMVFIILLKRENLLIAVCLPLASLLYAWIDKVNIKVKDIMRKILLFIPITIICIFMASAYIDHLKTINCEEAEITASAFSVSYLAINIFKFIKGLFYWKWYLVFSYFLIAGIILSWTYKLSILPIILYFGYLLLYTLHYRSYYFIKGADVSEIDFVRYMINMILIYSLIAGIGLYKIINYINNIIIGKRSYVIYVFLSMLTIFFCGLSYYHTNNLRQLYYKKEYMKRILPTINSLSHIDHTNAVILTSVPLLYQIFGPKDLEIIDLTAISIPGSAMEIDRLIDNKNVYYIDNDSHHNYYNLHRWAYQLEYLSRKKKDIIYNDDNKLTIYKLSN